MIPHSFVMIVGLVMLLLLLLVLLLEMMVATASLINPEHVLGSQLDITDGMDINLPWNINWH